MNLFRGRWQVAIFLEENILGPAQKELQKWGITHVLGLGVDRFMWWNEVNAKSDQSSGTLQKSWIL